MNSINERLCEPAVVKHMNGRKLRLLGSGSSILLARAEGYYFPFQLQLRFIIPKDPLV